MKNGELIDRGVCTKPHVECAKLHVTDWMKDVVRRGSTDGVVEVRFKNTRKDFYRNVNDLKLEAGDIVAIEANPGHDIGIVSLIGELVPELMLMH